MAGLILTFILVEGSFAIVMSAVSLFVFLFIPIAFTLLTGAFLGTDPEEKFFFDAHGEPEPVATLLMGAAIMLFAAFFFRVVGHIFFRAKPWSPNPYSARRVMKTWT